MRERPDNAVLTSEEVLWITSRLVSMPEGIEKEVFTALEALWGWRKPVNMRERPNNGVLTSEEVL